MGRSRGGRLRSTGGRISEDTLRGRRESRFGAHRSVLRFVCLFCLILVVFYAFTVTPLLNARVFPAYMMWIADTCTAILRLCGEDAWSNSLVISSARFSIRIVHGCDAIEPIAIFAAAVLATPLPFWARTAGVVVGAPILVILNIARLVSLFFLGIYLPSIFNILHIDVLQTLFGFVILLLWMGWAILVLRRGVRHGPTRI